MKGIASLLLLALAATAVHAGPAEKAYRKGDLARARRLYEQRLARHPEDLGSRYDLGNVLYRSHDLKAAEEAYRRALASSDPSLRARAAHNLGNAELQSGRFDDAIRSYMQALRADPSSKDSKYNLELALRLKQQPPQQQKQQQQQQQQQQGQGQNQPQKQSSNQQPPKDQGQQPPPQAGQGASGQEQRQAPSSGDYTKQDAERVLDGLAQEERDLQADRLRARGQKLRVEKDW